MDMATVRLLFRWGVNLGYSEWRPDQPHEGWSGRLDIQGGTLRSPRQVIYHGQRPRGCRGGRDAGMIL